MAGSEDKQELREMTGAELRSMLKSSINLKSLGGMRDESLTLDPRDLDWFRDGKIGFFFHWGLYSILGQGEWTYFNDQIPKETYEGLAHEFNPENFDMEELVTLAKDFGAKYMVMVTKHHDGFALWDSPGSYEDFTSYKTGSKRDFVREYVDAARKADLGVGLYYSPMDWRFPGYFDPKGLPENAALMKKQCYNQVEELCRDYGPVDIMWYDGGWLAHKGSDTSSAWFWEPIKLNKMVRKYNPKTLINPRSGYAGDFYCDEGSHEIEGGILPVPWEKNMCVCSGRSWGWMENDPVSDFDWLIHMLINVVCRGGNFLLNVGPDRNGKLSEEVSGRMRQIGEWLGKYGDSIYGTRGGPFEPMDGVFGSTYKDNKIYLHILDILKFEKISLNLDDVKVVDLPNDLKVLSAQVIGGQELEVSMEGKSIKIILPEYLYNRDLRVQPAISIALTLNTNLPRPRQEEIVFTGKE